ncbi:MAG: hypothetical protein ICV83_34525, partial [Cytophagales bacterium]|nr:hypothetical protein [Cytophagales bacterium]
MESHYALLNSLGNEFSGYASKLSQLIPAAYSRAAHWRWASASQLQLELFGRERAKIPKGHWLKERPQNKEEYVKVGLDQEGRIIVEEEYQSHPLWGHDRIYVHAQDRILALEYDKQKKLQKAAEAVLQDDKQTWYVCFATGNRASSVDRYVYDQGRITAIESLWLTHFYVQTPTYYLECNDTGRVESVRRV